MRILIVEDDPGLSRGISFALSQEGYETVIAESKKKALEFFNSGQIDAMILDLNLPDGDGIDFCRYIRTNAYCKGPGSR